MADAPWSVAFAGTGDTTENNAKELLDDWLPGSLEHITVPDRIGRSHKGLKVTRAWLAEEVGEESLSEAPVAGLADVLIEHKGEGAEVYLVYIPGEWDEESDEAKLVRRCIADQIPVKDLTAGLDDFVPPEPVAPEGENKPATRQRGRARAAADEEPAGPTREEVEEDAKAYVREAVKDIVEPLHGEGVKAVQGTLETVLVAPDAPVTVALSHGTIQALLAFAGALAEDVKASVKADLPGAPKPQTYPYWVDEDGNYRPRKGRGRPRRGEQPADLTLEEAAQLGLDLPE